MNHPHKRLEELWRSPPALGCLLSSSEGLAVKKAVFKKGVLWLSGFGGWFFFYYAELSFAVLKQPPGEGGAVGSCRRKEGVGLCD